MKTLKTASISWFLLAAFILSACGRQKGDCTSEELSLIHEADSIMRVLTITDSLDRKVLRSMSTDFSIEALLSPEFAELSRLMLATVTHPSQEGVGIAAPQVGINRRVVAVQRFDKEGEPFEVYPNVRIVWASDSKSYGIEGCLSVPDRREKVLRSQEIVIEYADLAELRRIAEKGSHSKHHHFHLHSSSIPTRRDTVRDFTAVIFQHEIDHLEGVLYIDRL